MHLLNKETEGQGVLTATLINFEEWYVILVSNVTTTFRWDSSFNILIHKPILLRHIASDKRIVHGEQIQNATRL